MLPPTIGGVAGNGNGNGHAVATISHASHE
jgi:hypothetical protein